MKLLLSLLIISISSLSLTLLSQDVPITTTNYRIAVDQDGNIHDRDDIGEVGMTCAVLSKAGVTSKVVYWGTSDHYWLTKASQESAMQTSIAGGSSRFGPFPIAHFFNVRANHAAAVNALTTAINISTITNPLHILGNGPMEVIGQAIKASNLSVRKYVTVYSQSLWNDNHAKTAGPSEGLAAPYYTFSQFVGMGVNVKHIKDQNGLLSTTKDKFYWLRDSSDPSLQWLYNRNEIAFPLPQTKFDCSGAGLAYYFITGDDSCSPAKLHTFLTQ